jgi:hypothetical protein
VVGVGGKVTELVDTDADERGRVESMLVEIGTIELESGVAQVDTRRLDVGQAEVSFVDGGQLNFLEANSELGRDVSRSDLLVLNFVVPGFVAC